MRQLGNTGVKVSRVALGTMMFGGDADEATSAAIWRAARDAGVNLFDTADVYNEGRSEQILGRLMREDRDQIVVASKAYFPTDKGANDCGSSRYHLVRAVEASLRRLATDRIDLYYVHRFDDVTALDETLRGLEDLVRAGKILYPACSNFAAWQVAHALGIQRLHGWAPLVAIQPMYNLVKRQAEVEILPMAQSLNIAVIPYSPTGGGLLTGKYGPDRRPEHGRLIETRMYTVRYSDPRYLATAAQFTALAAELGHAPAALAVAWVASHPGVTSVLIGGRNLEQLAPTLAAGQLELDAATRARISALSAEPPPATDRNEEVTAHNYGAR
ncbi:MAG TPA: aldo/keto reductase [Kofleriaceae bacterium]|jgi:aryl-alcohol dehydrogenase-like predicted oxidoreductase|nr:aldo/keto reductase [Kofleriaceae bacterium]